MGYFSALTGLVERPDLKKLLDRKKRHSLAEQGEYAYMATLEAFRNGRRRGSSGGCILLRGCCSFSALAGTGARELSGYVRRAAGA